MAKIIQLATLASTRFTALYALTDEGKIYHITNDIVYGGVGEWKEVSLPTKEVSL